MLSIYNRSPHDNWHVRCKRELYHKVFNFKTTASAATWSYAPGPVMEHNSKNPSIPDLEQVK